VRTGGTFLPATAAAAIFSICFGLGMRQLAGRLVMSPLEHTKNIRVEPDDDRKSEIDAVDGVSDVGTKVVRSS
jgi:hypothetical protein